MLFPLTFFSFRLLLTVVDYLPLGHERERDDFLALQSFSLPFSVHQSLLALNSILTSPTRLKKQKYASNPGLVLSDEQQGRLA